MEILYLVLEIVFWIAVTVLVLYVGYTLIDKWKGDDD